MQLFDLRPYCGKRVCVALSGGADSVCLLDYFRRGAEELEISLSAVHVEHGIRGEESLRDMVFCEKLCKEWGIPLKIFRRNIPALAKSMGLGLEEAARNVRYEIFREVLSAGDADYVATAHHADDVAETVLFRLARGTSPAGMRAFGSEFLRPLLNVKRKEILAYLKEYDLPFMEDSTNTDETYTRNYIRRTVLPAFEKIHESAAEHLVKFALRCAEDDDYLTSLAREEITRIQGDFCVPASLPDPIFLRACLLCMDAEKDYTSANLLEIRKLKALGSGKKVCLPGGQFAAREYENIVFYRPVPPFEEHPFARSDVLPSGKLRADLDAFPEDCTVRTRREGDFIIPFGGQRKTLKKFFTDKKISSRLGGKTPLIACGSEILVVCGVEIADRVKVTQTTTRVGYF